MSIVSDCLTLGQLERLASNQDSDVMAIAHARDCASCRAQLDEIRSNLALLPDLALFREDAVRETVTVEPIRIDGYEIHESIARGSQGVIYRATQSATKRAVAIKVLLGGKFATARQRSRFEREVELAAALRHPNIVTFFDSGITRDGRRFCVMELVNGRALDAHLEHLAATGAALDVTHTLGLFKKIASAVQYAHQRGVIHRDLKPANILIDAGGEPRVVDFGLARLSGGAGWVDDAAVTRAGEFAGTFAYASPEQTVGRQAEIDIRTDVYSLGVVLYEMLTGALPYPTSGSLKDVLRAICEAPPRSPSLLQPAINHEMETILLKALSKAPNRRYQSVGALMRDVDHYLAGEPIDAKRDSRWYLIRKTARRYRVLVGGCVLALSVLAAFSVAMSLAYRRASVAEGVALQRSLEIAEALTRSNIERGRALSLAGNGALAEEILWREHHAEVGRAAERSPTRWALREHYLRSPCIAVVDIDETNAVTIVATLSPDATAFLYGGLGAPWLTVIDPATGERLAQLPRAGADFTRLARFTSDRRRVACVLVDQSVALYDVVEQRLLASSPPMGSAIQSLAFSADGTRLAVGVATGDVVLMDGHTLAMQETLAGQAGRNQGVAFTRDGERLASASAEGTIRLWTLADRTFTSADLVRADENALRREFNLVAFSAGDRSLGVLSVGGRAGLWEMPTLSHRIELPFASDAVVMALSPDGAWVATGGNDRVVRLWNPSTGEQRAFTGHAGGVRGIAFNATGDRLVTFGMDLTLRTWDLRANPSIRVLARHEQSVLAAARSADGAILASGSLDGVIQLVDVRTGVPRGRIETGGIVQAIAFSRHGLMAIGNREGDIQLWRVESRQDGTLPATLLQRVDAHQSAVAAIAFGPDGQTLASAAHDKRLCVWRVGTDALTEPHVIDAGEQLSSLSFSPDGQVIIAGGKVSRTIRRWRLEDRSELPALVGHGDVVRCVAYSPDGTLIASGSDDQTVRLWDARSGACIDTLEGHRFAVFGVSFPADGATLWTASAGGEARIWDVHDRRELAALSIGTGVQLGMDADQDGRGFITWGNDRSVIHWAADASDAYVDGNAAYWRERSKQTSARSIEVDR